MDITNEEIFEHISNHSTEIKLLIQRCVACNKYIEVLKPAEDYICMYMHIENLNRAFPHRVLTTEYVSTLLLLAGDTK